MAFPYVFESNFEQGTNGEWDSESDTGSLLDFPHYHTLSTLPNTPIPWRGAYLMRIDLTGGSTDDHTLTEADIDIADTATRYFRWYMWASSDFTASADDTFNIFELQKADATPEISVGMRVTATTNALDIGIGDGTAPTSFATFPRNKWVCVELLATISTIGAGVVTLFLDELQVATLTSQTHSAAVTDGVFGTQDTLATTTGTLYFDQFVMDDGRIYGLPIRYPETLLMTKTAHAFVGAGVIESAQLLSGAGTNNILQIYDTDQNNTLHAGRIIAEMGNTANGETVDSHNFPVRVQRGAYVVLSGTGPRALVNIKFAQGYSSVGRIRQHGAAWLDTPGSW